MLKIYLMAIYDIIIKAPLYVWFILGYLLFIGIKATKQCIIYLPKLFIIPAILLALKYQDLIYTKNIIWYAVFILIGMIFGTLLNQNTPITIDKKTTSITVPGTYLTITILMLFFITKYIFGYLKATNQAIFFSYSLTQVDLSISLLFSGYFLGRAFCYLYRFIKA